MKVYLLIIALTLLAAPPLAHASDCPADARKASLALWPGGSIPTGKTVTGTHPCGRQLTCTGGVPGNFPSRQCRWE
jgi:hypothetical protein